MNAPADTLRAFLAIHIPSELRQQITQWRRRLEEQCPPEAVRWTPPEQIHLTLKFFGTVPSVALPELESAIRGVCEHCRPLQLQATGAGCFPNARRPRVLWVGLQGDLEPLSNLQVQLEAATSAWGERQEAKLFHPHLTLGRVRDAARRHAPLIGEAVRAQAPPSFGRWTTDHVHLMRSDLSPQGATHMVLAALPL